MVWFRYSIGLVLAVTLTIGYGPSQVFAHQAVVNNGVEVQMHVIPDDDPIAGEQSKIDFFIHDSAGRFKAEHCICTLQVSSGRTDIVAPTRLDPDLSSGVVFPERGVYVVTLAATPKNPDGFRTFLATFSVRIERDLQNPGANRFIREHQGHAFVFGIGMIVMTVLTIREFQFRRKLRGNIKNNYIQKV